MLYFLSPFIPNCCSFNCLKLFFDCFTLVPYHPSSKQLKPISFGQCFLIKLMIITCIVMWSSTSSLSSTWISAMASASCRGSIQAKCRVRPLLPLLSMAALQATHLNTLQPAGVQYVQDRPCTLYLCGAEAEPTPGVTAGPCVQFDLLSLFFRDKYIYDYTFLRPTVGGFILRRDAGNLISLNPFKT